MKIKKKSILLTAIVLLDCFCAYTVVNFEANKESLKNLTTANNVRRSVLTEKIESVNSDVTYTIENNVLSQEDIMMAQEITLNQQLEQVEYQNVTNQALVGSTHSSKSLVYSSNVASNEAKKKAEAAKRKINPPKITYGGKGDVNLIKGADIAAYAKQFKGNPYVWGGTSLTKGADCSGFVQSVYKSFGIGLPRTASQQALVGTEVSIKNIKAGDLVFYSNGGNRVTHVAIYIGNGKIIHARTPSSGIGINSVYIMRRLAIRRIVTN